MCREDKDEAMSMSCSKRKEPNSMQLVFSLPENITSSRPLFALSQPGINISAASKDPSNSTFKLLPHLDRACARPSPDADQGVDVQKEKGPQAGGDLVDTEQAMEDSHAHDISWSLDDLVSDEHTETSPTAESPTTTTADAHGLGLKFGPSHGSGPSLFGGAERPGITLQQVSHGSLARGAFSLERARFNPPTEPEASETGSDAVAPSSPSGEVEDSDKLAVTLESVPRSGSQPVGARRSPTCLHPGHCAGTPAPTVLSDSRSPQPQPKDEALPSTSPSQKTDRNPFLSSLPIRARSRSPPPHTAVSSPSPVLAGALEGSKGDATKPKPVATSSPEGGIRRATMAAKTATSAAARGESSSGPGSQSSDGRRSPIRSRRDPTTKTPTTYHSVCGRRQRPTAKSKAPSPKPSRETDSNTFSSLTVQVRPKSPLVTEAPPPTPPVQRDVSEGQLKSPYARDARTRPSLPEVQLGWQCDKPDQYKLSSEHVRRDPPTLPAPTATVVHVLPPPSYPLPCQILPPDIEPALANQTTDPCVGVDAVPVPPVLSTSQTTAVHRRINFSFLPAFSDFEVVSRIFELSRVAGVDISILTYRNGMIGLDEFAREVKEAFMKCTSQNKLPTVRDFYHQLSGARPSVEWEFCDTTSDAAQWRPLSKEVSAHICHQCSEGGASFELLGPEENYLVDLSRMTITGALTGRIRQLRSLKPVWSFFQDDEFGFVPFSESVSREIEDAMLFGSATHLTIDGSHCTVDFERDEKPLLLHIADESEMCCLERNPPLSYPVVHEFKVEFSGNVDSIEHTIEVIKHELESQIIEKDIDVSSIHRTFRCLLYQMARQYCVEVTMSTSETIHLHLQGTDQMYLDKVSLQLDRTCVVLQRQMLNPAMLNISTHSPGNWEPQKEDKVMVPVEKESSEWKHVHSLMEKTIPSVQLVKLERVQNVDLWRRFHFFRSRMEANKEELNEKDLFHGTRTVVPTEIINDKRGFDFRCARDGMWGAGIYFAVKASYSDKNYAYKVPGESCKQLLLARVLTGKSKDLAPDRTLRKPPAEYDTVTGTTNGSRVYVVYDHEKAYPAYLITYTT